MKCRKDKGCHAVYTLQFHYICTVKYRRRVLREDVAQRLLQINQDVAQGFGIEILEQNTDLDHLHMLFSSKPQVCLSRLINSLKSTSSRLLRKEFPELKKALCGSAFWSPSYFLASTGEVSLDVLIKYVQNQ
ncbi:MAG: IS200/IS605 family transposase [Myxococcota bacterium]